MPVKLIPRLRFLNPPATALQSIKVEPTGILSRFFPFNLNHGEMAGLSGSRSVSAWSFRSSPGGEAGASKSLIEDEAELSDWVSSMRTGSLRGGRGTSDEEDDFGSRRGGGRDRGRGRGRGREGFSGDRSRGGGVYGARSGFDDREVDRFGRRKRGVGLEYGSGRGRGREVDFGGRRDGRALGGRGGRGREGDYYGDEYEVLGNRGGRDGGGRFDLQRVGRGRMDFGDGNSRDYGGRRGGRALGGRGRGRESDFSDDEDEMLGNSGRRGGRGRVDSQRGGRGKMEFGDGNGRGFGGRRGGRALGGRGRGFSEDEDGLLGKRGGGGGGGRFDSHKGGSRRMEFGDGSKRDFGGRTGGKVGTARKSFLDKDEDDVEDKEEVGMIGGDLGEFLRNESESEDDEDDDGDDDGVVGKNARTSLGLDDDAGGRTVTRSSGASESYLSETRFDQCDISPLTMKAVKDAGYEKMTVVQEATLPVILKGKDVLAKAKTGTGKTVAFLLPSIEVVAAAGAPSGGSDQKRPPFFVLVICPTRELASQAASEATKLLKYHTSIGVQVVIGGTRLALEQKRLQANPCQILVATPGRLRDHIENTAAFATRLMGVKVLILDEADHLLDMGFRKDIENIVAAVPKQRQTLLFSATVPNEVRQICHLALKRDHEYINTVEEGTEETHAQVRQIHLVAPLENQFPILYTLLKDHIADNTDYKVLVFCTTAMVTRLVADLLGELHLNVREIHSRKPQSYRTRVSEEFRKSKGLILVTSDVSARGVDYPDVTLVVQVGVPADRQQYIHRLGRTGRKGKEGEGILILAPWEEFFVSTIKDLPITKGSLPSSDPDTTKKVERALSNVEMKNKEAAYQAWLGYYNSNKVIGRDKCKLVELASSFSSSMGLDNPPALPKLVIGKMGLKNVPGLRSK